MPGGRLVAAAERLEHADAGCGLLHVGGQVALLVLGAPGQHPVPPLEAGAEHHHGQEDAPGQQAEPPVQPGQQRDDCDEGHHVGDEEDDAEPGEPPDRGQVGGGPGQQLAGLPLVMEPGVQPLQMRIEAVPHRPFHAGDRAGLYPPPVQVQRGLEHAERDRGQAQGEQRAGVPLLDRPVDHGLDQQRDRDHGSRRADRGGEHQCQLPVVGTQVLAGPPQGRQRRLLRPVLARRPRLGLGMRQRAGRIGGHYPKSNRATGGCHLNISGRGMVTRWLLMLTGCAPPIRPWRTVTPTWTGRRARSFPAR